MCFVAHINHALLIIGCIVFGIFMTQHLFFLYIEFRYVACS